MKRCGLMEDKYNLDLETTGILLFGCKPLWLMNAWEFHKTRKYYRLPNTIIYKLISSAYMPVAEVYFKKMKIHFYYFEKNLLINKN
jgi:competence CoiA-like predicted nuclease